MDFNFHFSVVNSFGVLDLGFRGYEKVGDFNAAIPEVSVLKLQARPHTESLPTTQVVIFSQEVLAENVFYVFRFYL